MDRLIFHLGFDTPAELLLFQAPHEVTAISRSTINFVFNFYHFNRAHGHSTFNGPPNPEVYRSDRS